MTAKEQYWKRSLIVFILFLGILIFYKFTPFLSGFLGACTVYVLVRKQMQYFTEKRKMGNNLAASIILIEIVLGFLIPCFAAIWLIMNQVLSIDLNPASLMTDLQRFVDFMQEKTGYNMLSSDNVSSMVALITKLGQTIVGEVSSFVINALVLLFVLYFMLVNKKPMEKYMHSILPFNTNNKGVVLHQVNVIVKSNAIGIPLLAIIQGVIGMAGYYIFGAPSPILFGFLTCFASIIPLVGTAIIWAPLVVYMSVTGDWVGGVGLLAYSIIVVSNVDNLVRFMLQKKLADTHPLITVFGAIIGLSLFGFWGVIFGPLLISIFLLCFNIFKEEYLDKENDKENS